MSGQGGSVLVVDVGTSGVRGGDRAARRHRRARAPRPASCPTLRPRGSSSSTRRGWPTPSSTVAARGPRRRRTGRGSRHRQPAGLERGLGACQRQARGPGHRLAGPPNGRDLPGAPGRGDPPRPQRVGHQGDGHPRRGRPRSVPSRAAGSSASARWTAGWPGHSRAAPRREQMRSTSRMRRTPAVTALIDPATIELGRAVARETEDSAVHDADRGRLLWGRSAPPRRSRAHRRSAAWPATNKRRSSARAAHSPDWPRQPSAPEGCSTSAPAPGPGRAPRRRGAARARSPSSPSVSGGGPRGAPKR